MILLSTVFYKKNLTKYYSLFNGVLLLYELLQITKNHKYTFTTFIFNIFNFLTYIYDILYITT